MGISDDKQADLVSQGVKAGVGAVSGGVSSVLDAKAKRRMLDEYIRQQDALGKTVDTYELKNLEKNIADNEPLLKGYDKNTADYMGKLGSTDYSKYNIDAPGEFSYDMEAETKKQMNPAIADIIRASTDSVQQSAANRGSLFSGAAAKGIANASATVQAAEYDKAAARAQQGYTNKYSAFTDKFQNTLLALKNNKDNDLQALKDQGARFGIQQGAKTAQTDRANTVTDAADTSRLTIQGNTGEAQAKKKGINSDFANFAQGALSGLAG
jgi:hypothetical protein